MPALTKDSTPAEVRKAWAERLRNPGNIVQGFSYLAPSRHERCCLGVLCDLAVEAGVIHEYASRATHPPVNVWEWAALEEDYEAAVTPEYWRGRGTTSLVDLNDCEGFTFADIAELLDDGLVLDRDGDVFKA